MWYGFIAIKLNSSHFSFPNLIQSSIEFSNVRGCQVAVIQIFRFTEKFNMAAYGDSLTFLFI